MIKFAVNQKSGKKISLTLWPRWLKKIEKVLKIKKDLEISIALVGEAAIRKLNQTYQGKDQVTDVLSFSEQDSLVRLNLADYLGEIIICYPQAKRQAKKASQSVNKEIELLLVHGFLHLLGYDHEKKKEAKVMRELEQRILKHET